MKGIFELRPNLPRYNDIWDVNTVFNYLRKQSPIHELTLKDLTCQLTFLLLTLNGKRGQTIHLLNLDNMVLSVDKCIFIIQENVKETRVGHHIRPITFEAYPPEPAHCVVQHLKEYGTDKGTT
jgi:hypothetical protein